MNSLFMLNEQPIHQERIAYSSNENMPFIFGTFLPVRNMLYFNTLHTTYTNTKSLKNSSGI